MPAKKTSLIIDSAKELLEESGRNFNQWKKEILRTKKLEIMEAKNQQWEYSVVEEAALEVITTELKERRKKEKNTKEANKHIEQEGVEYP
ncbi:hypothetical protein ABG980_02945 [Enterococcus casseliflavus]|uniref:DUF5415 family protein n=1 Tax=Enterococcus casseliflavus TaxID=37734 RepID=UPI002330366A|nr:hypothetical protein [Enterococcus casseliflavus]MDB1696117.1 hypothetical protein [Enterococcus casseliflavus]MDB1699789.1 hypothetical protein [Enterococcus casseliflavus]MDB1702027.1 hypothetical protein [Enterococcus casseliflavus]MDB1704630.1 hypothetical protein [Enterococcus casseliflavus]